MAQEKNFLIVVTFFILSFSSSWGATVCTTYEGKRLCGNSIVVDSDSSELKDCTDNLLTCKKLVITNSHLTSGSKVEICDKEWKCSEVQPKAVLNDVVNDVAVFEIPQASPIKVNSKISGDKISSDVPIIYPDPNAVSVNSPEWVKGHLTLLKNREMWESEQSGFGTFVVERGMSGSPIIKPSGDALAKDVQNDVLGIVTGHHNYIPVSTFVKKSEILAIGNSYLKGERGLTEKSEKLGAEWHYSQQGKTTFRSLKDGTLWETGTMQTPSGGGTETDTGGGTGTDTGGGTGTDTGGGTGTDTGGGTGTDTGRNACSTEIPLSTAFYNQFNKFYGLYHGVIINDKKVYGFKDKKTGRIIHANWELITQDDIASGKFKKYEPLYEEKFNALKLLATNRPDLKSGSSVSYCIKETNDCVKMSLSKDKLKINDTEIALKDMKSSEMFKNIPVKYASGKNSTIWLADFFIPDARLDHLRDSKSEIVGGNHKTKTLDILIKK